ncbi:M23 family metallopeptidase [Subdoligranulum variabile]|uniref:Peptidase, M23 family n=1 Tax=Subdoligranulum variabile DSM 15176 TaxID=411471 RepID=D1PP12_9FIRM|nr:M23 family metallopeptidase [Subdoligranulum variabile]EFB75508.1 peptidase, M23 family [Subdoligranulum variabile DSM 15176]UWP68958.1 M23 family metallopeptidase [Subdoligranulum variabile]
MNHIKSFFKEKGLYLFCLALVFAATAAGILALRSVVNNMSELTQLRKDALQEDSTWTQPDTTVDNPASDVPKPTTAPSAAPSASPSSSGAQSESAAASAGPGGTAAPSAQPAASSAFWQTKPIAEFSGEELVYNETLGDWRTHNGADYAAKAGEEVSPVCGGTVTAVTEDALWGTVVEITDQNEVLWRYCGLTEASVKPGEGVTTATTLGKAGSVPAESKIAAHIHLECLKGEEYQDPESMK